MKSQMDISKLYDPDSEYLYISNSGIQHLASIYDSSNPQKNVEWTTDFTIELPIKVKKAGKGSEPPYTLVDAFHKAVAKIPDTVAMRIKRKNKWVSWTFKKYYEDSCNFGKALLSLGVLTYSAVNIIGFNSPEWFISFFGSIFANYFPIGIYTTNTPDACKYVVLHSEAEVIVAENKEQLKKFIQIWDETPRVIMIVLYSDVLPLDVIPAHRRSQVMLFDEFLNLGRKYKATEEENSLEFRMMRQKPGNCCTLVYTSGTTGPPKGVMISHDNYTWTVGYFLNKYGYNYGHEKIVSYLPLSHVAAQIMDITGALVAGAEVIFAGPDALQGSLVETLKEIRPTFFFSVPRVWEKIEEKMKIMAAKNNFILKSIGNWAKSKGKSGSYAEFHNKSKDLSFTIAKKLVFDKIKSALGLDQARFLMFGAAPMSIQTQEYFLSLNLFLINTYGMSECSGPQTVLDPMNLTSFDSNQLSSCGKKIDGTDMMLYDMDKDGNGEICYKGRNRFMGYFKNEKATKETIDATGFLHSGDVGKIDERGNLTITGRIKELLITAGGENIPPVLIEDQVKKEIPFISNAMLIGDKKKYLVILLTLKYETDKTGNLTKDINRQFRPLFKQIGSNAKTYDEFIKDKNVLDFVKKGIENANKKATSRAQEIKKWKIIPGDFTVDGGELTPTLKLKRKVAYEKYKDIIEPLYEDARL